MSTRAEARPSSIISAPEPLDRTPTSIMLDRSRRAGILGPRTRQDSRPSAPDGSLEVTTLTGRDLARWDRFVRCSPSGTFFHTIAWMHSVRDAFGHQPHCLLARRYTKGLACADSPIPLGEEPCPSPGVAPTNSFVGAEKPNTDKASLSVPPGTGDAPIVGVLPLFRINSLIGGTMLISAPYAVAGGVLAEDPLARSALLSEAKSLARTIGARTLELRSETACFDELSPIDGYVSFRRQLPDRADDVLSWLPRKARAAARNGEQKHGLVAEFSDQHLRTVWRLYCRSMRRLGSINYPYRFFEELLERSGSNAFVQVVRHNRRIIAGLVSFRFNDTFSPYFVGCDERFNRLGTNNFLYLAAMRQAVEAGCRVFDFGRTRASNKGSYDFKRFHGFEPKPLGYQRWVPDGGHVADLTPSNPAFGWARRVWRYLPAPVCSRMGAWASKHIPG